MRAFIQSNKEGLPYNPNAYAAYDGFKEMGFETVLFVMPGEIPEGDPEDIVVGGIGTVRKALLRFGVDPPEFNYPDSIRQYLKRDVWESTIDAVRLNALSWPVFVKPFQAKLFTGKVIREYRDLTGLVSVIDDKRVFCSEVIGFESEYRAFVRYGEVLDIRHYKGDWKIYPDPEVILSCVNDYVDAPAAYAADFGVTDKGETVLVEVNDGYSVGAYGLGPVMYAQFLSAYWAELTNTEDCCDFYQIGKYWKQERDRAVLNRRPKSQ